MFCPKCAAENDATANHCTSCGAQLNTQPAPVQAAPVQTTPTQAAATTTTPAAPAANIPNYLVQAILATLCCCLPGGIVAIVYASQVNGKVASGDINGAMAASKNAKMWCWISLGVGLVINTIWAIVQFAVIANS